MCVVGDLAIIQLGVGVMNINVKNFMPRRVKYIPPYFTKTTVPQLPEPKQEILERWIYKNCFGRFGITNATTWENKNLNHVTLVAFEEPTDMTLFALLGMAQIR